MAGAELQRGAQLGRYVVLDRVGSGAMAAVYAAWDSTLGRKVALKVLHPELRELSVEGEARARMLREAQAMARLQHPNVVAVYDVGSAGDEAYISMEFVEGETLRSSLQRRPRSQAEVLRLFLDAGKGLGAAHAAGVVHRDFKPDNVLIDAEGRVRVTDFGLARPVGAQLQPDRELPSPELAASLTAPGSALGTPAYMAPEQLRGGLADAKTDQFNFCVALYEALYGERPFSGASYDALAFAVSSGQVRPPPKGSRVSQRLRRLLLRGLAVKPEARFPTMEALLRELAAQSPRRVVPLALAGVLVLVAVSWAALTPSAAERCRAQMPLAAVWTAERSQAVRAALLATQKPYSAAAAEGATAALSSWTQHFQRMHGEVCDATHLRSAQSPELLDLRMACLDHALVEFGAVVAKFEKADALLAEHAVEAAQRLPVLQRCADAEGLLAIERPPSDPATTERVRALRNQLAEARAQNTALQFKAALATVTPALEEARALRYWPLVAEAAEAASTVQLGLNDHQAREAVAREGVLAAERGRADALRMRLLVAVADTLDDQNRAPEALVQADLAEALVDRLGPGHEADRAAVLISRGNTHYTLHNYAEALKAHDAALALMNERDPEYAHVLSLRATDLWELRQTDEALEASLKALALREKSLGADHPDLAASLATTALVLLDLDRVDEAVARFEQARSILEKALGPKHRRLATTNNNLAQALRRLGTRNDDVIAAARRAIDIALAQPQPPVGLSKYLGTLGDALLEKGDIDGAEATYRQALEVATKAFGPTHQQVASQHRGLGDVAARRGKYDEAVATYQKGLAMLSAKDKDNPDQATLLLALGRAHLAAKRWKDAVETLEHSLRLPGETAGPDERFLLGQALWEAGGDKARAVKLVTEAAETYRTRGARGAAKLEQAEAWLSSHR